MERVVKTTIQIFHDKGLFDNYVIAHKVYENVSFVTRRISDLEKKNTNLIQGFFSLERL